MAERTGSRRPRQDDRLLPLGGFQYLVLLACQRLEFIESTLSTAMDVKELLVQSGLEDTNVGQVHVTFKRLIERGLLERSSLRAPSLVDSTRQVYMHRVTVEGSSLLSRSGANYALVMNVAGKLEIKEGEKSRRAREYEEQRAREKTEKGERGEDQSEGKSRGS